MGGASPSRGWGVPSSAQWFLVPSLGLCWAGAQLAGYPSFALCGVLSICGLALLDEYLISPLGCSLQQDIGGRHGLGGKEKDFLEEG